MAREVRLNLPETGVCSATPGAKAVPDDATVLPRAELSLITVNSGGYGRFHPVNGG